MIRCEQNVNTEFQVDSSSASKKYRVRAFLPDEPPTCDCVAFAIARNRDGGKNHGGTAICKHIRKVLSETCGWMDVPGADAQKIPGVCPLCAGPTRDSTPVVMPEDPNKAADEAVARLQALAADLGTRVEDDEDEVEPTVVKSAKPTATRRSKVKMQTVDDLIAHLKS